MKHVTTRLRRLFAPIGLHWYLALLLALDALMVLRPVVAHAKLGMHHAWLTDALNLVDNAGLVVLPQVVVAPASRRWPSASCCVPASRGCCRSCC